MQHRKVRHRADVHRHRAAAPVEVGHLQHHLRAAGSGDDPFGQAVAHAVEHVGEAAGQVPAFHRVTGILQRIPDRPGGRLHAVVLVGEQVHVLGGQADDPVRDQRVAAAQREAVLAGRAQRDDGHVTVEVIDRHAGAGRLRGAGGWRRRHGRGGAQDRVALLPRLADILRQEQFRPHRDQRVPVQVCGQILRAGRLPAARSGTSSAAWPGHPGRTCGLGTRTATAAAQRGRTRVPAARPGPRRPARNAPGAPGTAPGSASSSGPVRSPWSRGSWVHDNRSASAI